MNDRKTVFLMFRDTNPEMVMGWLEAFSAPGPWSIGSGNILRVKADAIVSPANSYGFMDGGIDLAYRNFFGLGIQNRLQAVIQKNFAGLLPVGKAVIIPTLHEQIPHLIAAPTMERPVNVAHSQNAYLAMKAVLETIREFDQKATTSLHRILIPGFCTGIGGMDPFVSAAQMRQAVSECLDFDSLEND